MVLVSVLNALCVAAFVLISVLHVCGHFDKKLKYRKGLQCHCVTHCTPIASLHKDLKANKHLRVYIHMSVKYV